MTTRNDIREYATRVRSSMRTVDYHLSQKHYDDASELAAQASGEAGEFENLVNAYINERTPNQFSSRE